MPQPPALLLRGARIVALDTPAPTEPFDVRIEAGRVAEIGPRLAASGERVIEADGAWLIPGLWDHHVHMAQWAETRARLDLAGTASAPPTRRRSSASAIGRPRGRSRLGSLISMRQATGARWS